MKKLIGIIVLLLVMCGISYGDDEWYFFLIPSQGEIQQLIWSASGAEVSIYSPEGIHKGIAWNDNLNGLTVLIDYPPWQKQRILIKDLRMPNGMLVGEYSNDKGEIGIIVFRP